MLALGTPPSMCHVCGGSVELLGHACARAPTLLEGPAISSESRADYCDSLLEFLWWGCDDAAVRALKLTKLN